MNLILATHYSTGDVVQMLSMMTLPSLIVVTTCIFSFIVWRKRKEAAFLVLAIGIGIQMLGVCIPAIFMWQGKDVYTEYGNFIWILQLPSLISLIGWGLLAKKKTNEA
jgi:hypothetical protein